MAQLMFAKINPDVGIDSHFVAIGTDETEYGQIVFVGYLEPGWEIRPEDISHLNEATLFITRVSVSDQVEPEKEAAFRELRKQGTVKVKAVRDLMALRRDDDIMIMTMADEALVTMAQAEAQALPADEFLTGTVVDVANMLAAWDITDVTLQHIGEQVHLMDLRYARPRLTEPQPRDLRRMVKFLTPLLQRPELAVEGDQHVTIKLSLYGKAHVAFGTGLSPEIDREYIIPLYALAPRG
jgi:hypothetical protein